MPYSYDLSLTLIAGSAAGIVTSTTGSAGVALTLNGGLVSGGVATFDVPRRVAVTSIANETAKTFTITGTDYYGRPQSETLTGAGTSVAFTSHDFATVSSILSNSTTNSTITFGTNGTASKKPIIIDQWVNPSVIGVGTQVGTVSVTYNIEKSMDNLMPSWDINTNTPTWYTDTNFNGSTTNTLNQMQGPFTMARLTVTAGTGTVTARFRQSFKAA